MRIGEDSEKSSSFHHDNLTSDRCVSLSLKVFKVSLISVPFVFHSFEMVRSASTLALLLAQSVCASSRSYTTSFVSSVISLQAPSKFQKFHVAGGLPRISAPTLYMALHKHHHASLLRSHDSAAATTTLIRGAEVESKHTLTATEAKWSDPVAVLLYNVVALQLLAITLSGQLQVPPKSVP